MSKQPLQRIKVTERGTIRLVVGGTVPTFPRMRVVLSGLPCGKWGEVELERWHPFTKEEMANPARFIQTPELKRRARKVPGFRGITTAYVLKANLSQLPQDWQEEGCRLHFLAHFLLDKRSVKHVLMLEKGELKTVDFDNNAWTAQDWFVRQVL